MFRMIGLPQVLILGVALFAGAPSVEADVEKKCGEGANEYIVIEGCTAIIINTQKVIPSLAPTFFERARAYNRLGAYKRAIADLAVVIKLAPDIAPNYYERGKSHHDLGDFAKAIADFDDAIRLKDDYFLAYFARGVSHLALKQLPRARADFDRAIELEPEFADSYHFRGSVGQADGDPSAAAADWERAVTLGGQRYVAWWKQHLRSLGLYSGAMDDTFGPDLRSAMAACAKDPKC